MLLFSCRCLLNIYLELRTTYLTVWKAGRGRAQKTWKNLLFALCFEKNRVYPRFPRPVAHGRTRKCTENNFLFPCSSLFIRVDPFFSASYRKSVRWPELRTQPPNPPLQPTPPSAARLSGNPLGGPEDEGSTRQERAVGRQGLARGFACRGFGGAGRLTCAFT